MLTEWPPALINFLAKNCFARLRGRERLWEAVSVGAMSRNIILTLRELSGAVTRSVVGRKSARISRVT